jgi:carboxylesterase type B
MHGSDLVGLYQGNPLIIALINFVNHLDPNGKLGNRWPKYSLQDPKNFVFGPNGTTSVQDDTYRKEAMSVLNALVLQQLTQT